jgi:hypothetical protein
MVFVLSNEKFFSNFRFSDEMDRQLSSSSSSSSSASSSDDEQLDNVVVRRSKPPKEAYTIRMAGFSEGLYVT